MHVKEKLNINCRKVVSLYQCQKCLGFGYKLHFPVPYIIFPVDQYLKKRFLLPLSICPSQTQDPMRSRQQKCKFHVESCNNIPLSSSLPLPIFLFCPRRWLKANAPSLHLSIPPHPFLANRCEILDMAWICLPGGKKRGFKWIDVGDSFHQLQHLYISFAI